MYPNSERYAEVLYKMKCGEIFIPDNNTKIVRVPGGWIYGDMQGTCFIPFDNEFQSPDHSAKEGGKC